MAATEGPLEEFFEDRLKLIRIDSERAIIISPVKTYNQVMKNVKQFNKDLRNNSLLAQKLSEFKH